MARTRYRARAATAALLAATALATSCVSGGDPPPRAPDAPPRPVWVIGEVARPGALPAEPGLTVGAALARAGGPTDAARLDRIVVRRGGANAAAGPAPADRPLVAGDVVEVPARLF
jgi:hypothetical protein